MFSCESCEISKNTTEQLLLNIVSKKLPLKDSALVLTNDSVNTNALEPETGKPNCNENTVSVTDVSSI